MNNETLEMKVMEHDTTIKEHGEKISALEKSDVKHDDNISQLCEKIDSLIVQNNKWFYGVCAGMAGILIKILFFK